MSKLSAAKFQTRGLERILELLGDAWNSFHCLDTFFLNNKKKNRPIDGMLALFSDFFW